MRIKGALHMHSTLSGDGTPAVAAVARLYRSHGYRFIAITEHAEGLDEAGARTLEKPSAENSSERFLVIPGLEFSAMSAMYILTSARETRGAISG